MPSPLPRRQKLKIVFNQGQPELLNPRKAVIQRMLKQRQATFISIYERQRIKLQKLLAKISQELKESNIEISFSQSAVKQKKRHRTGHLQLHITGIKRSGTVDWTKAKKSF